MQHYDTISKNEMLRRYDKRVGIVITGIRLKDIEVTISKYINKLKSDHGYYDRATLIRRNDDLLDCAFTLGKLVPFDKNIGDTLDTVIEEDNNAVPMYSYINNLRNLAILD